MNIFQVATIWILPVILLQSLYWNKIKRKRKLLRDVDRLTPPLTLAVILLSVPNLINSVAVIALYPPTPIMVMTSTLCVSLASSCKIVFYVLLDKNISRDLLCKNNHVLVPTR